MSLTVLPVESSLKTGEFDLFEGLASDLVKNNLKPENGDVFVISSKYVANSQGRVIELDKIVPSSDAKNLASKFQMKPKMAEIILRESDVIFGGISGFVLTSSDNILAPNAGIDKSNTKRGNVVLYPDDSYHVAEQIRRKFLLQDDVRVGIIIADSRLMPGRAGTVGIAISCSGIEPTSDLRGQKDLHGNPLKVTFQAVADNLASIANLKMGEGADVIPVAIIRNSGAKITDRKIREDEMAISYEECVYVRGLGTGI